MFKKFGRNLIFFLILLILMFVFLFKGMDYGELFKTILKISPLYILLGLLFKFCYLLGDAINIKIIFKEFGVKMSLAAALKYSFIGFFYSAITPSSTGGQPMQIYHMKKDGIDFSHSTMVLLILLTSFHIATLSLMIIGVILNWKYLIHNMHFFTIIFVFGVIVSFSILLLLTSLLFSKKAPGVIRKIVKFILKLFNIKSKDKILKRLDEEIANYSELSEYLKTHKSLLIKVGIVTIAQIVIYHSIPYISLLAFGKTASYIKVMTIHAVLFSSIQAIPLPGSIGVNEIGFKVLFGPIFGKNLINSAVLLTRFMEFYLYVIISAVISIVAYLKKK